MHMNDEHESSHDGAERGKRREERREGSPMTRKTGDIWQFAGGLSHARHAKVLDMLKAETRKIRESAKERV